MSDEEETKRERFVIIRDLVAKDLSPDETETLRECPWCKAKGMVSHEQYVEWLKTYPEIGVHPEPPKAA
jgi:hypothetical protein